MRYKHLIFLLFISLGSSIFAQLSKKHYIPPLTSSDGFTDQYIYISTPKSGVNFTIKRAGSSTIPSSYSGTVSNGSPLEIAVLDDNGLTNQRDSHLHYALGPIDWELPNTPITDKGFIIEATDVIFVSIRVRSTIGSSGVNGSFHAGALVSKGLAALGKSFRIGGFERAANNGDDILFASVMATENNTKVEIKEVPTSLTFLDGNTGPFDVDLNEGESYIIAVRGTGNTKELLGGLIESNKNIVVNAGSAWGSFGTTDGNSDYGFDQIVGDDKIGKEYILVKGLGLDAVENILVIAHKNNTQLFVNNNPYKSPLNKGEYYVIEGNEYNPQGLIYLNSTEDVFVYQGISGSSSQANQGLFFVPPLGCESTDDVDEIPYIDEINEVEFDGGATVISNKGANVQVDGVDINTYSKVVGKEEITTNLGDYIVYTLYDLTGNVSFTSDKELYCNYYNSNNYSTTAAFYSGFPIPPTINFDVSSAGCISTSGPPAVLTATNVDTFDSYEWQFLVDEGVITDPTDDDWRRAPGNAIKVTNYNPTQIGQYRLVGTTCSGDQYTSPIIPVSQCASDIDNDGVIDNLDVDMDNDGIRNCDESLGGLTFNLSNPNSPSLSFNNTRNPLNSFVTGQVTKDLTSNDFTGDSSGNFTSSLTTTSASSNRYNLKFNEKVNFKMTPDNLSASTDDDFFILRIGPNTKNISIINNDDQLLIDSDFDGVYESGVQRLDAYEIRFKINTSVSSGDFEIVAKEVGSVTFEHYRLNGSSTNSSFSGKIELTCFAKDSDGDGIEDALDLDSDNDGIPDLYENETKDITLLGDSDNDGLDDIFGTNPTLTDTDKDLIPNYLDLDSDNDGIYDIIESGFNLNHTNGMITGVNSTNVGNNGLFNTLETSIDSGILNALPLNSDANSDDVTLRDDIFNFADLDSDGDDCFDVLEAGYDDPNEDGILGDLPDEVDIFGKIINEPTGYTTPNPDYLTSAPIIINSFTDTIFCEDETNQINIDTNLDQSLGDTWQWEVSTDNGTTWADISNITPYSDSTTNNLTITKTPASFDGNLYRVKLGRAGRSCDPVTSNPITLTVNRKPKVYNASIIQCISVNNTNPTVNLTTAQNNISSATNVTFKFYTDNIATNEILTPNSYPVTPNVLPPQSVWVTATDNVTSCVSDVVELVLNVNTTSDINPDTTGITTSFSDDSVNPSTGIIETGMGFDTDRTTFIVLDKTAIEKLLPPIPNTNIFYFENITDRANSVDDIDITGFRNDISKNDVTVFNGYIQFPIYFKIVSKADPDCYGLGEFKVQIYDTPNANSVSDIEECDDAASTSTIDGRNSNINLRDKEPDILGTQDPNIFKVTFHKTPGHAFNGTSEIQGPENYTNDPEPGFTQGTTSEQIIYVRVENTVTRTFNANTSFKIIIQPIPTLSTTITNLPFCDVVTLTDADPRNRIAQNIDLTVKDAQILTGSLSSGYVVEYYNLQGDAEKRINKISNPENFENDQNLTSFPAKAISDEPGIQTIFFVVVDKNGLQCPSVVYSFDLEVYPEPYIAPTITTYSDCDNDDDGDDTNGQIQGINLNGKIPEILGIPDFFNSTERNSNDYKVTFYATPEDAAIGNETNKLPSLYDNELSDETIWIRVENKLTGCVNSNRSFKIIINKLPSFTVTTPQILCLNDLPLNIFVENPDDVYSYQWYDPSGNPIAGATDEDLDINEAGTYRVKAIDNTTFCERIEEIIINESNVATLDPSFVTIVDESNNLGASNSLSISIDTINNDLGPGDYQFAILNTETNTRIPFIGFQDDPLFEGIEGGIYQIIVNDKNGCVPDATLLVSVLQFPKFFTPNGDSQNDFWVIKGTNKTFYPNSSINIFNRYGKLVAQMEVGDQGWDGTFNGRLLPSDDYWYHVILVPSDPDKPRVDRKGNFSLLRR